MMIWSKSILVYLKQNGIIKYTLARILKFCCALTAIGLSHIATKSVFRAKTQIRLLCFRSKSFRL